MMMLLLQAAADAASTTSQVVVTNPGITTTVDAFAHQAGLVAITVWGLQMLKRVPWFPWINANTETATRIVSTLAALVAALAVQFSVTGDSTHGWSGTFAIPGLHVIWDSFIRFAGQKMGQEWLYNTIYNKPMPVVPVAAPAMDTQGKPLGV